jgi:peroxiredoxin
MSRFSRISAFVAAVLLAASCGRTARINALISDASSSDIVVKMLNVNTFDILDTVTLDQDGKMAYKLELDKGQIEFVYLYHGGKRIASLLLQPGDKVSVVADTLGTYSVEGSEESARLAQVEMDYAEALKKMTQMSEALENAQTVEQAVEMRQELAQEYVKYYRGRVSYIMQNSRSMTVVPVLYQTLGANLPVFAQQTDAIHFRSMADSLALSYPDSRYVRALRKEAERRLGLLEMESLMNSAQQIGYPDIELPDINGQKRKLSEVDAKVVIVHFWTATNLDQKLFNADVFKSLYEEFHGKGLEIYQVSLDADKILWAQTVKQQVHPWISVCDSRAAASPYAASYNIQMLPSMFVISDGELVDGKVVDEASLKKLLRKLLK